MKRKQGWIDANVSIRESILYIDLIDSLILCGFIGDRKTRELMIKKTIETTRDKATKQGLGKKFIETLDRKIDEMEGKK